METRKVAARPKANACLSGHEKEKADFGAFENATQNFPTRKMPLALSLWSEESAQTAEDGRRFVGLSSAAATEDEEGREGERGERGEGEGGRGRGI